jgi:hypothetical protein
MEAPIIIDNFGDLLIFESVEKAERYLEPVDVENGEYQAFDRTGRRVRLSTDGLRVRVGPVEEGAPQVEHLRQVLQRFLSAVGVPGDWLAPAGLDDLVREGLKYKTE